MPQTPEEAWEAATPLRLTREQAELLDSLQQAPRAISHEADFEAMTWTFKIEDGCRVGGGTYALVWMPNVELTGSHAKADEEDAATVGCPR